MGTDLGHERAVCKPERDENIRSIIHDGVNAGKLLEGLQRARRQQFLARLWVDGEIYPRLRVIALLGLDGLLDLIKLFGDVRGQPRDAFQRQLQSAPTPPAGSQHSCQPTVNPHIIHLVWFYPLGKG